MKGDEPVVEDVFCPWLESHGWKTERQVAFVDIKATGPAGQRVLWEAKGSSPTIGIHCDVLE